MRASDLAIALHRNLLQKPVALNTEPQCVQVRNEQTPTATDEALAPGEDEPPIVGSINMSLSFRENSIQLDRGTLRTGTVLGNYPIKVEVCSVFTS